jgi:hypothetical protein
LALKRQGGQSAASYLGSAADWPPFVARVTPKQEIADFCAAEWPVFTPPLTQANLG